MNATLLLPVALHRLPEVSCARDRDGDYTLRLKLTDGDHSVLVALSGPVPALDQVVVRLAMALEEAERGERAKGGDR